MPTVLFLDMGNDGFRILCESRPLSPQPRFELNCDSNYVSYYAEYLSVAIHLHRIIHVRIRVPWTCYKGWQFIWVDLWEELQTSKV
ncbi:hypothetical protein ACMFMF_011915 [Clarireedia jacksonii]